MNFIKSLKLNFLKSLVAADNVILDKKLPRMAEGSWRSRFQTQKGSLAGIASNFFSSFPVFTKPFRDPIGTRNNRLCFLVLSDVIADHLKGLRRNNWIYCYQASQKSSRWWILQQNCQQQWVWQYYNFHRIMHNNNLIHYYFSSGPVAGLRTWCKGGIRAEPWEQRNDWEETQGKCRTSVGLWTLFTHKSSFTVQWLTMSTLSMKKMSQCSDETFWECFEFAKV